MDITWDEFQTVAPHLDEVTQLRVMNAVLALRLRKRDHEIELLNEQLRNRDDTIERLEQDVRESEAAAAARNGAYQ